MPRYHSRDNRVDRAVEAYLRVAFPTGLRSTMPEEDDLLGDLLIDLDQDGSELYAQVLRWNRDGIRPDAVEIDETIDARLLSPFSGARPESLQLIRSHRDLQRDLAHALRDASGAPIRHRRWQLG
jgi:hypothetical protein